jgi:hypothetical protein
MSAGALPLQHDPTVADEIIGQRGTMPSLWMIAALAVLAAATLPATAQSTD